MYAYLQRVVVFGAQHTTNFRIHTNIDRKEKINENKISQWRNKLKQKEPEHTKYKFEYDSYRI